MVHNKQFILSKQAHVLNLDWRTIEMPNGYILSFQKNANIVTNSDNSVLLLGDAWAVEDSIEAPELFIRKLPSFEPSLLPLIDENESAWNGRYLLITGNYISLDAVGAYGVYFSDDTLSSSLPLLCQIENRTIVYPNTKWGDFPDFVPGPYTQIDGVKRILPSQRYNYKNKEFSYHKFLINIPGELSEKTRLIELSKMFKTSLNNMYEHYGEKPIWLALTGGKDSRTALAFLSKTKIPYHVFTYSFSEESTLDAQIARICAILIRKRHYLIAKDDSRYSKKAYEDYKEHTMLMNADGESVQIPYGMYEKLQTLAHDEFVILRNNAWESIMDYFRCLYESTDELIIALKANGKNDKSIEEWLDWVQKDSLNTDISLWDRIFWEQREGSWLSAIEQSLELIGPMASAQMCNSRKILSYMHSFPFEKRRNKWIQIHLTKMQEPFLARIPYDGELHQNEQIFRAYVRKNYKKLWNVFKRIKSIIN